MVQLMVEHISRPGLYPISSIFLAKIPPFVTCVTFSHPAGGSMIRPEKVNGIQTTIRQEIEDKYLSPSAQATDSVLLAETQRHMRAKIFEVVGMDKIQQKQSHWEDFDIISICQSNASYAGNLMPLMHLSSLDLTATLIDSWTVIADVCRQVPTLQHLNLS